MIRLQRSVPVYTFDAEATVAVGHDRPEFLALARLAADLKRPISGGDVSRELLGGLPEQVGWLVIDRGEALGLLERTHGRGPATLSRAGAVALEQGAVLVPEEDSWRFYFLDDPLVDDSLIHVARLQPPNAKEERNELYKAKRERQRPHLGEEIPELLEDAAKSGHVWTSITTGKPFELRRVSELGLSGPQGQLRLTLEHARDDGTATFTLRGELGAASDDEKPSRVDRSVANPSSLAGVSYEDLWMSLVRRATGLPAGELASWRQRAGELVLPVAFDDLHEPAARQSMRRDLAIPSVTIGELGDFEPSTLQGLRLVPRTDADAQRWAEWLQWEGIRDYATPTTLQRLSAEVVSRFPFHKPNLPGAGDLLRRAIGLPGDSRRRLLLAPADLGLWR